MEAAESGTEDLHGLTNTLRVTYIAQFEKQTKNNDLHLVEVGGKKTNIGISLNAGEHLWRLYEGHADGKGFADIEEIVIIKNDNTSSQCLNIISWPICNSRRTAAASS